jgi:hypothetical protein
MKKVIDHLQKCGNGIFEHDELDEPLMMTYGLLRCAVRDYADIFIVHPSYIEWHKDGIKIGEWKPETLIPIRGFSVIVEQIIKRDQTVNGFLKLASQEGNITTYKIVLTPQ